MHVDFSFSYLRFAEAVSFDIKKLRRSCTESIFWYFFRKFWVVSICFGVCFETVCFGCFGSVPKQKDLMFRLNRNKQKTNWNNLIETIFSYFLENFGLFRFVSKQFSKHRNKPKPTEIFCFWFYGTNRNTIETDHVSVCFGLNQKFLFVCFEDTLGVTMSCFDIYIRRKWIPISLQLFRSYVAQIFSASQENKITVPISGMPSLSYIFIGWESRPLFAHKLCFFLGPTSHLITGCF